MTTAQATTTMKALLLQHCHRSGHDHDLDLDLTLYQPWNDPRLLRWWRLGLGIAALGFV
jgi:hypothetical protein